jgi:sugar diacid utilization regulator
VSSWPHDPVGDPSRGPPLPAVVALLSSSEEPDANFREQLSNLQGLLVLSMLMTEAGDERKILNLASTAVPSLGRSRLWGVHLHDSGWRSMTDGPAPGGDGQADLTAQLAVLGSAGGVVAIPGEAWGWAFPLRSLDGEFGYLVVAADNLPPPPEQFLLRVLAQQAAIALANARLHSRERARAVELRVANAALAETVASLKRSTTIHDRLTQVAVAGEGQEGIARAVHELTGLPVAIEDRHGNLTAWAGPDRPYPYPKDSPARREQMLRHAREAGGPVRTHGRVIALARPRPDIVGVLALLDPEGRFGAAEQAALEHGATVLAMELARLWSIAEAELRVGRDLVEELLVATDDQAPLLRAQALGYDLERPHRVVVISSPGDGSSSSDDSLFHAVRRAARDVGVGSLQMSRGETVVLLSDTEQDWEEFRAAVVTQLGGSRCRVGVGSRCLRPTDFRRSYREAGLALRLQAGVGRNGSIDRAISFDDLGVLRLLLTIDDTAAIEGFAHEWLGPLLDYDAKRGSEMVATLTAYLEFGGSYAGTAEALAVHRSTLKYRLQRIEEISGYNLSVPDIQFNLHVATRAWQVLETLRAAPS